VSPVDLHDPTSTSSPSGKTILCVSSYFKGNEFLEQCKRQGYRVVLLTLESLLDRPWARQHIDEVFGMPSLADRQAVVNAVSYLARTRDLTRISPLDDYDVETAAHLREHLRIPGMGETTARYFRDKLAMRARARDRRIAVPEFVHVLNDDKIRTFLHDVKPPWLLKPRSEAASSGIKKLTSAEEAWQEINTLGDNRSKFLIERMIPGDFFHVDGIVSEREVLFAEAHGYRTSLLEVAHHGGIFVTRTLDRQSEIARRLLETNRTVVEHLNLVRGVIHIEYVRSHDDGRIYFIEAAARVGGVYITNLVEATTGINLWHEWAKIELGQGEAAYELPARRSDYGGLIVSLSRQETPDTSAYTDPEICWQLSGNPNHVGFIVRAPSPPRVEEIIETLVPRIAADFTATLPPVARPAN
jgi:biotin carboxylase